MCVCTRARMCMLCAVHVHVYNIITVAGCLVVSVLRAVSFFGFCGGITNWIAVELFFVKIPLIYGRYVYEYYCESSVLITLH